jgi:hypothetical protein
MQEENFIAFWTIFGFFMGTALAFIGWTDPFSIFLVIMSSTFFFYILGHFSVALFVRFMEFKQVRFDTGGYDQKLDYFYQQLLQRERLMDQFGEEERQEDEKR